MDDTLTLWEADSGKQVLQVANAVGSPGSPGSVKALAFSPDGTLLAAGGGNGRLRLRETATGNEVRSLVGHMGMVNAVAFSPDGKTLASCSQDRSLRLWDVATGKPLQEINEFRSQASCLAFSPDGRLLATAGDPAATGSADAGVSLWDTSRYALVRQLPGHRGAVRAVAFSPDGKTLASGGADQAVRLWEVATGKERRVFAGSRGTVFTLAFSPNGQVLASGGMADPTVLLWDVTGLRSEGRRAAARLRPGEAEALWANLASDDAAKAYHAVWALALSPAQAVPLLRDRLKPLPSAEPDRLARLVADLDNDRFAVREKASRELEQLAELAVPALRKVLDGQPSVEVRRRVEELLERFGTAVTSAERLRGLRGIEVLEQAGTSEARAVLEKLAGQAPESDLTREAKGALERLARRPAAAP
jgi:dipeptidyl aminopeptidase/acylaminoacyl peptidase